MVLGGASGFRAGSPSSAAASASPSTTVDAYKLTNSYSMTEDGLFGETVTTGFIEQHFVKGLGLVKEKHSDSENGSIILLKSLTGYSGLEIED